jgi:hypothetical protein
LGSRDFSCLPIIEKGADLDPQLDRRLLGKFFDDRGVQVTIRSAVWNRLLISTGLFCLAMTLLLLPLGVQSVRAEDGAEALMSIDPTLAPIDLNADQPPRVAPMIEADAALPPGMPGIEIQSGVIGLNTRGYNYGPMPAELDPAAIAQERNTR